MILDRLRIATRPAHERLERSIDLLGRDWSRPFYLALLQKFHGFYAAVEPQVLGRSEWRELGLPVENRRKLGLLRRDLVSLGMSARSIDSLPLCDHAPAPSCFAQALGCAYVLEGSTLGGQVITRHLRRELGLEPGQSCAFFTSYGGDVGKMWHEFVGFLNSRPLSPGEESALLRSACETFASLDGWLSEIV
jgi:heme oxygenase